MFQKQDIYWIGLACTLMVGGYSLIWSSEPEIRSFSLKDEINARQESEDSDSEAARPATLQKVLELAQRNDANTIQD